MRVAVRQRATETSSAGIRRCAYLLPSTRVFAPPTLRRSACCLTATRRPAQFRSPPTLRRSACCLTATRQRVELPTSENANEGSDSCSVKHSEAMRVAVRQRATETSSAGIRRCAYLLFTAIHPRFRPTDLASVGLLPESYQRPTQFRSPPTLRRSACCLNATAPAQFRSPPTLRRSACCLTATKQRVELPTSENANEGSDSCSVKHSEAMEVAVRQRATETSSAGIRRCAYLLPSTRVFAPPTLRRSACCLTATRRPTQFRSPPTLRRSACCLTATRQRVELPTSENANGGSDSCSVKHSEAMRVAVRQRATETSSAGIRRCAYLLPSTRVFAPPTLCRSACCLKATSAQRNSAPHRPCVGRLAA